MVQLLFLYLADVCECGHVFDIHPLFLQFIWTVFKAINAVHIKPNLRPICLLEIPDA